MYVYSVCVWVHVDECVCFSVHACACVCVCVCVCVVCVQVLGCWYVYFFLQSLSAKTSTANTRAVQMC